MPIIFQLSFPIEYYFPTIKVFIKTLTQNFHSKLPLVTGAPFINIGQFSIHPRFSQEKPNTTVTIATLKTPDYS